MQQRLNKAYFYKQFTIFTVLLSILLNANIAARPNIESIDHLVEKTMRAFRVPGVAVGVVQNDKIIHLQGYGTADISLATKVDEDTVFKIASNSKAFTSAALAILVDQGKLNWHDKVIQHLPEFKMFDPWVTTEFNIIDLLTHRSGLNAGAGDLMLWPEPTRFTRKDVVKNLRYLQPVSSFRNQYAYDNLLYIVAGEVISAISGKPWEVFIKEHIFEPLGLKNCYAGGINIQQNNNIVAPHIIVNDQLIVDKANLINNKTSLMAAAGGIKCSAKDLLQWVNVQLNGGLMKNAKQLFSKAQRDRMWQLVTALSVPSSMKSLDNTHFRGYALGWRVSDFQGHWKISHTGSLSGSMSQIVMLPDANVGIVILTNQQSSAARNAIARGITQEFTGQSKVDWVAHYVKLKKTRQAQVKKSIDKTKISLPAETPIVDSDQTLKRLGLYNDPWFGKVEISKTASDVVFKSAMSPRLTGKLYFNNNARWWVKWDDRSFYADSWLYFSKNKTLNKITLTMKPIFADTDFSFDFEDLNFIHF